jgi:hypothetical protein
MVLQSTVDTRVGLLKDDCIQMDMEHRKQEYKIEKFHKQKEEEVSLDVSSRNLWSIVIQYLSELQA